MGHHPGHLKLITPLLACRPKFLLASAAPVLVGSALGFATEGSFNTALFILALFAITAIHAGANMAIDYFDHLSGNDRVNQNPTPFSGGSRFIQNNILSPKTILTAAVTCLAAGSVLGIVIVIITKSLFVLMLGITGLLGGFFYTAPPIKLGYRSVGEIAIAILCGLLPVLGAYFLQTNNIDLFVLLPASIVALLIFAVILVNEFPDLNADTAVNKKTLIVTFGVQTSIWIYRTALLASFLIAVLTVIFYRQMFFAALFYLFTAPLAVAAVKSANKKDKYLFGDNDGKIHYKIFNSPADSFFI